MLTDRDLISIISAHREDSLGVEDGELTNERAEALDRYHGRPYGNELEGRSAIVSKDLSEAIDWAMPAIMRVFTQSGSIAEFDPVSPEDERQAELETEYVNQVIMKDNAGWLILHDAIKDTLMLKNGYVKHWWEESEKIEEEEYRDLTIGEIDSMMNRLRQDGAEIEIVGQDEKQIETPQGIVPVFDLKIKIKRKKGRVVIEAIPSEEIRVSRKCRGSLQDAPFVEHVTLKPRSDLIEMGMDKDFVNKLAAYADNRRTFTQALSRDSVSDESNSYTNTEVLDMSMDMIEYCEAYIRVDYDGDGVAELRRVVTVSNQIPEGEEWNKVIPEVAITGFVAKRIPHRHVGESLYDELGDLMEIKTTLLRQLFDNIYLTNNNQWLVNERVNINDFITSLPGGIKRVEGIDPVSGSVEPIMAQPIVGQVLPVIDYVDGIKESRTGISRATTGLDPDTMKQSTKGAFMENMNRASQKVEMITRMIAETGVKEMVLRVHSLLLRYQDKQRLIRMKGQFVEINPREWQERTDLTVKVGLGTGNEEDRQRKLMMVAELQANLLGAQGLVAAPQAFALFSDIAKTLGFDTPDKYGLNPQSPEFQQRQQQQQQAPNPLIQVEQMKLQAKQQESQMKMQADQQQAQMTAQIEQQKAQQQLTQEQLRSQNDIAIEREKIAAQMELERYKAQLQAETQLRMKAMELGMVYDTGSTQV